MSACSFEVPRHYTVHPARSNNQGIPACEIFSRGYRVAARPASDQLALAARECKNFIAAKQEKPRPVNDRSRNGAPRAYIVVRPFTAATSGGFRFSRSPAFMHVDLCFCAQLYPPSIEHREFPSRYNQKLKFLGDSALRFQQRSVGRASFYHTPSHTARARARNLISPVQTRPESRMSDELPAISSSSRADRAQK